MNSENRRLYGLLIGVILVAAGSLFLLTLLDSGDYGPTITINAGDEEVTVFLSQMQKMDTITKIAAFENQYENIRGAGEYLGVRISTLVELVGGMEEGEKLIVSADDGYNQTYTYSNVYPNSTELAIQGDMVLAFSFNESLVPEYTDGYRVMFLPDDGLFSNNDAMLTTPSEYYLDSAGARCVRNVISLLIMS